jgi:S-adenosylhomocysteine hydrolase
LHGQQAPLTSPDRPFTEAELAAIRGSMPLTSRFAHLDGAFDGWALLFRDHYLEHSVGFVLAMQRAGIPAEWIFTMAKGDRTRNRERIDATFKAHGYRSAVFDNAWIDAGADGTSQFRGKARRAAEQVDEFISSAHHAQRKVLAIDDGGLLALGYGRPGAEHAIDAALELTVSGLKRITAAGPLNVPVWNMARSSVKTKMGYAEIADSCLRRLRFLLPAVKFIGRSLVLLGFGTLGSKLAPLLKAQGCRVCVVDTDVLALITAAEAGFCAHRTAAEALKCARPFLVLGTTGEIALSAADLEILPDGSFLAPFATRDFSVLRQPDMAALGTELPGLGWQYDLPHGLSLILLGDGRSLNLFEADSIPNQGYDAYRAGTLIAAQTLCRTIAQQQPGVFADAADAAIAASGLYDAYFDLYLGGQPAQERPLRTSRTRDRACVVGYGTAGRLHTEILTVSGMRVTAIDPKHHEDHEARVPIYASIGDAQASGDGPADIWSVCTPTADHLPALRQILLLDPAARILLEKPACHGHEIGEFEALLERHPRAKIIVNDQYRHATALAELGRLLQKLEPGQRIHQVTVTFTKDRQRDIDNGRFVDRTYGVLGYEWLHMLAVLHSILPTHLMDQYLNGDPLLSDLYPSYDERLFVASLHERTTVQDSQHLIHLELASSITGALIPVTAEPGPSAPWQRAIRAHDDRHRHVTVRAGQTRFALHLEPVTAPGGWQLDRNQHRLTADRAGNVIHDQIIVDSPMHNSIHEALAALRAKTPPLRPNLDGLRRIAALAAVLKSHETHDAAQRV